MKIDPSATHYEIQRGALKAMDKILGSGVLIEGDLDEILSRDILRALRSCEPEDGRGWNANVEMGNYYYNLGWTAGLWGGPLLVRNFGPPETQHHGSFLQRSPLTADHGTANGAQQTYFPHKVVPNSIVMKDKRLAGWHISWTLDGAEGIANKILNGHIEGYPDWAKPYINDADATNPEALVAFLRDDFLMHPDNYDHSIHRVKLENHDLPKAIVDDRDSFKDLLGEGDDSSLVPAASTCAQSHVNSEDYREGDDSSLALASAAYVQFHVTSEDYGNGDEF